MLMGYLKGTYIRKLLTKFPKTTQQTQVCGISIHIRMTNEHHLQLTGMLIEFQIFSVILKLCEYNHEQYYIVCQHTLVQVHQFLMV